MHVYSADSEKRIRVIIGCVLLALVLSMFFSQCKNIFFERIGINEWHEALLESILDLIFSLGIFGGIYWCYTTWFWKKLISWHKIPDLSGKWEMEIQSSVKGRGVKGQVEIRQTWTQIGVHTKSESGTEAKSHMGEIVEDGLDTYFKYAFLVDRNGERYIGFNELRYDDERKTLEGCYFTSKKFSKRQLEEMGIPKLRDKDAKRLENGIGSKGIVYMKKIT